MTKEEIEQLVQENQKLNARLQKAVTVFNEQKSKIERLTAERDETIAKSQEADKQDQLFFEQQQEIEQLKEEIKLKEKVFNSLKSETEKQISGLNQLLDQKTKEAEQLTSRIEKALKTHEEQKATIATYKTQCETLLDTLKQIHGITTSTLQ